MGKDTRANKKVYLLYVYDFYGGGELLGVFASKEDALREQPDNSWVEDVEVKGTYPE